MSAAVKLKQSSLELFEQRLPARPYCSNSLVREGLYRLPLAEALSRLLIQPNTAKLHVALCFDVDRPTAAIDWQDRGLPVPNLSVKNPKNGHAHLIYLLEVPVPVSELARIKPIKFMAAIQEGMRRKLDADRGYAGLVVKNPRHANWTTVEWTDQPYDLAYLAEYVDLPSPAEMKRRAKCKNYAGLGRNCTIFEIVRRQAYSLVRDYWRPDGERLFREAVIDAVIASNHRDVGNPLSPQECRTIARSIAKWIWRQFTPAQFREVQSARGKAKGAEKRSEAVPEALRMSADGHSQRQIAEALGVDQKTVSNWLRKSHIR
jgi:hypothetical protein